MACILCFTMNSKNHIIIVIIITFCFTATSEASKSSWSEFYTLSNEGNDDAYRARVVCDSQNNFHVVWKEKSNVLNAGSDWDLFYKYRMHHGEWSELTLITTEFDSDAICLSVAIDSMDTLHLAWKDTSNVSNAGIDSDIFYTYKPYGTDWSDPILISNLSTGECSCPEIIADNKNTIHLTYADTSYDIDQDSDADIMYTSKTMNGTWKKSVLVNKMSTKTSFGPHLGVDSKKNVHIVWYEKDEQNLDFDVFYATKNNNSTIWSESILLSSTLTGSSVDPWIETDLKNTVHLIWMDNTNIDNLGADYDIYYRYKRVNESWSPVECISQNSISNCKWLGMTIDDNDVLYAAWSDETEIKNNGNDYDILMTYKSVNNDWSELILVTNKSSYESNWPRFTVDKTGVIHMTWWDRTPERWITYYQQGQIEINNQKVTTDSSSPLFISTLLTMIASLFILKKFKKNKR